jgi:hypothetical protein
VSGSPDEVVERDPVTGVGQRADAVEHRVIDGDRLEDLDDHLLGSERQGQLTGEELGGQVEKAQPVAHHLRHAELGERVDDDVARRVRVPAARVDRVGAAAEQQLVRDHLAAAVEDRLAADVDEVGAAGGGHRGIHDRPHRQ